MSEAKVQDGQVIYEEMKTRERTAISTREHPGHPPQCPRPILDTEFDDLGADQLFVSESGKFSELKMFSTTTNSIRTIDELVGGTTV